MSDPALEFDGRQVPARAGDTVASALYRSGVRIFSRSFKVHRPRGLLCCAGKCPNCLVNVDGVPNVRACTEPVRDGMKVSHQNASPSLEHDRLSIAKWFGWLMPVGFYYKTFTRPFVWKRVEPLIRKVAGLGVLPEADGGPEARDLYEHLHLKAQVAVVGGGPAGMSAAIEAAEAGADVVLVDDQPRPGGHLAWRPRGDTLGGLRARLAAAGRVRVLTDATCFGLYEGNLLGIVRRRAAGEQLVHLRAKSVVVATGETEVPILFENNDLPGVMLSSAVRRLIRLHGVKPGEAAVVVARGAEGTEVAEDLKGAGVRVEATLAPESLVAALGRKHVQGVRTPERKIACDLVVLCGPRVPEAGLVAQAGGRLAWSEEARAFLPAELPPTVFAAGHATGTDDLEAILAQGRSAGRRAAGAPAEADPPAPRAPGAGPFGAPSAAPGKSYVCFCEDVTDQDLRHAVVEGFDQIETLKRYTTVTMGPCQGKMCQLASIGICARETGRTVAQTGRTTSRPPTSPVSLGALAGARSHPVKRTPMHAKHDAIGCVWMDMGEWKRPLFYGKRPEDKRASVETEYRAVRERAGIIDLSTLGKLDVQGKDAPRLLDKVYTNRISDLRAGRTRYGVICDEAGIILDDGTVSRTSEDRFFVTTTTGNLEFVHQWLDWWAAGTGWCVHVTNVTGGCAAVNVAGPKARDLLRKLTDCDLGSKAFPYMACAEARVAGVPCFLMRIGFVGETGWEIHFPAEYGEFLWDALLEAGREFDARPFGVEAQRLLRLEKKHVIVGVDTDATTNVLAADMAWLLKAEKEDFIGKAGIARAKSRELREKLVGFVMEEDVVPEDGASMVLEGRPVGRVTSVRFSPARGKAVGMAWVPAGAARDGSEIQVHVRGAFARARIVPDPFYDPEGKRLKS